MSTWWRSRPTRKSADRDHDRGIEMLSFVRGFADLRPHLIIDSHGIAKRHRFDRSWSIRHRSTGLVDRHATERCTAPFSVVFSWLARMIPHSTILRSLGRVNGSRDRVQGSE